MGLEFKVTWQREGCHRQRRIYQSEEAALREVKRQETACDEMDWVTLAPLAWIKVESREVGKWS